MFIHIFAFFVPRISQQLSMLGQELMLVDNDLIHRLVRVLRIQIGDECVLFDEMCHVKVVLRECSAKKIIVIVVSIKRNISLRPVIHALLPLLKKDDLEQAVASLVAVGVNEIHLVYTEFSRTSWQIQDQSRLERLIIASAEQAKHYVLPRVHAPHALAQEVLAWKNKKSYKLCCMKEGVSLVQLLNEENNFIDHEIGILCGPEADFSDSEKEMVRSAGFQWCSLTQTVLRSWLALTLAVGIVRTACNVEFIAK